MRRILSVVLATAGLMVAAASPAAASWGQTTNRGVPGHVTNVDWRGAEGGICGDPQATVSCSFNYNQIFVNKYRAYTAPYAVAQTVSSIAYLYWYDRASNNWKLLLSSDQGSCRNLTGNGVGHCTFGSSASDVGYCPCTPAFYNLPRGRSWTVVVRVNWWQYSTGQLLSQADYYPTSSATDIGCAGFAYNQGRCTGPHSGARLNLPAPTASIGYILMN